jgi:predicted signal transduction protein with EAL and GGDEF domain
LQAITEPILGIICAPFVFNGHSINIGASIRIALIDSYVEDASDILRYADMALYRAKNDGSNRACIYDAAMDADLSNRKLLEGALRQAIRNQELRVVYQSSIQAARSWSASRRWRAGFIPFRAKYRQGVSSRLRVAGVHSMQVYRFSKPVAAAEIDARLASPEAYRVTSPDQEIALAG